MCSVCFYSIIYSSIITTFHIGTHVIKFQKVLSAIAHSSLLITSELIAYRYKIYTNTTMITTQQWRVSIGAFAGGKSSTPSASRYGGMKISTTHTTTRSWYGVVNSSWLCTFSLFVIIVMLIMSGDIELNPGPVNCKTCPRCLTETVSIKLKVCSCGYVFNKKSHRQPPNHHVASNVKVVTNDNITPDDQVQSQPIGGESVVSHMKVANDTVTDDNTVPIVQVQSQPVVSTSLKWQKYKAGINKNRRENID